MKKPKWLENYDFLPVIRLPQKYYIHDFSQGEDLNPTDVPFSVGKYNEKRRNMYTTELFQKDKRDIHMGVDIAAPVGTEIYNFFDGELVYLSQNKEAGDYGPTLVYRYNFNGKFIYALFGHLSLQSLHLHSVGDRVVKGALIGHIGDRDVNGGWFPHLHFQLSLKDPGEANMPGVVSDELHSRAMETYPDPRWVLGPLY